MSDIPPLTGPSATNPIREPHSQEQRKPRQYRGGKRSHLRCLQDVIEEKKNKGNWHG